MTFNGESSDKVVPSKIFTDCMPSFFDGCANKSYQSPDCADRISVPNRKVFNK